MTIKKNTTLEISTFQKIFIVTGLGFAFLCFVAVYLSDTGIAPIDDTAWYKIFAASSVTSVGSYLFGSSTARK